MCKNCGFHRVTLAEVRLLQASRPFLETEWMRVAGRLCRLCAVIRGGKVAGSTQQLMDDM